MTARQISSSVIRSAKSFLRFEQKPSLRHDVSGWVLFQIRSELMAAAGAELLVELDGHPADRAGVGRFRLRCCFRRRRRLIRFFCRFCFLGGCFRLRRFGLLDGFLRLRGLRRGDHRRDNGRGGRGAGRVLKLGVERRMLNAVEQVQEQAVDNALKPPENSLQPDALE